MPLFKRNGKTIFGCQFNQKEQEALEREVRSQLAEWSRKNMMEIDAMFLWFMHEKFGFGMKRLRRVYFGFRPYMEELAKRYEMKGSDTPFLCTKKLLDYGVDLEQWDKEVDKMVEHRLELAGQLSDLREIKNEARRACVERTNNELDILIAVG